MDVPKEQANAMRLDQDMFIELNMMLLTMLALDEISKIGNKGSFYKHQTIEIRIY
jgi:hypothetical protein